MLRSLDSLKGFRIIARDGEAGAVDGFFIDEKTWDLRYFIVTIGGRIFGRKIFLAPYSIEKPLWTDKKFMVPFTSAQLKNSPEIDPDMPLSREMQASMHGYYGWPEYWNAQEVPEAGGGPSLLRSRVLEDFTVQAADGEVGMVEDMLVDDMDWVIRYLITDTRRFLPGKKVLISPDWITSLDMVRKSIHIDMHRDPAIKSPGYDPSLINRDFETRLHAYYGKEGYWTRERKAA